MSPNKSVKTILGAPRAVSLVSNPRVVLWFCLIAVVFLIAGFFYYSSELEHIRKVKASELAAIAEMKVAQIVRWRRERGSDAKGIANSSLALKLTGRMVYEIRENDLTEVLTEVQKSMSVLSKRKGLDLCVELAEDFPKLKFDRDRLIQVLTNLMSNAIQNTERGSVTLAAKKENDAVHLSVQDAGSGIPAEDIPKLFQSFDQLDSNRAKKKGGTGLGLAISKEIILAHHGKIWAESEVGKGSTFHFTLPL